jgi:putative transcriptional regulator
MLKCNLSRIMGEKKLRIADVARATRVNRNLITLLYYERAKRIDFRSLEKLCRFLECAPGELLELAPGASTSPNRRPKPQAGR